MTKRYGLIGCGMMGLEHIRNLNLMDGADITLIFDPVDDQVAEGLAVAPVARRVSSIEEMATDTSLDAIIIASPNDLHVDHLELIAGARHIPVLCEKPLFTNAEDVRRITRLQRDYTAPIWVAMEYRYMPPIEALIEQGEVATGGIKLLTIKEHRFPFLPKIGDWNRFNKRTGGTLVEKCCHFFDLMRLILKSEPVTIFATAGQITNHLDEQYDGEVPDIWDGGYVVLDFENGARANLELAMFADGSKWNEEIHAVGPMGKIACRLPGPQRFWPEELGPSPNPELSLYPRHPKRPTTLEMPLDKDLVAAGDHHGSTYFQHQKFLNMLQEGSLADVGLEDGIRAVQIGLWAQQSAIEKRAIHVSETDDGGLLENTLSLT